MFSYIFHNICGLSNLLLDRINSKDAFNIRALVTKSSVTTVTPLLTNIVSH